MAPAATANPTLSSSHLASAASINLPAPANRTEAPAPVRRDWTRSPATGFALVAVLLLLWELSARGGWVVSDNWPPFSAVVLAIGRGLFVEDLALVLGSTLYRMLSGYVMGSAMGVLLGLVLGANRTLSALIRPVIEVLRTLPSPAIVPPLILFLGVDDALKIVIIALASFFPVFVNTYSGVRSVDETLLLTARTFGLGRGTQMRKIILPAALPSTLAGMRISLSLSLVMAVIAEMISGSSGIGHYLMSMQYALRADMMYASIICLAGAGYLLNRLFHRIERRLLFWNRT